MSAQLPPNTSIEDRLREVEADRDGLYEALQNIAATCQLEGTSELAYTCYSIASDALAVARHPNEGQING